MAQPRPRRTSNITKDFNGLPIVFREDGYINMTKAAKAFGKRLDKFFSTDETRGYIEALDEFLNHTEKGELIQSRKGRYGGTFCHPKLAIHFGRWLDVRFAVWCDLMIDNILQGNIQTTVVVPTRELPHRIRHKPEYYSVFNELNDK